MTYEVLRLRNPESLYNLLARPVVEEQALHVVGLAAPRHLPEIALAVVEPERDNDQKEKSKTKKHDKFTDGERHQTKNPNKSRSRRHRSSTRIHQKLCSSEHKHNDLPAVTSTGATISRLPEVTTTMLSEIR